MKLKNNIHKIISVGDTIILPGKTEEVDSSYENNPVVSALVKRKDLSIVKEKPGGRK